MSENIRIAASTPVMYLGDPGKNAVEIKNSIGRAVVNRVNAIVLPELCITGSTCGSLFSSPVLLREAEKALMDIVSTFEDEDIIYALGLPVRARGLVYNAAALCYGGEILALVPKKNLSIEEKRYFADPAKAPETVIIGGIEVPFGDMVAAIGDSAVAVEFYSDLMAVEQTSPRLRAAGANVILCMGADPERARTFEDQESALTFQSRRLSAFYAFANAGEGESSAKNVYRSRVALFEPGRMLDSGSRPGGTMIEEICPQMADYDLRRRGVTLPAGEVMRADLYREPSQEPRKYGRLAEPNAFYPLDEDKVMELGFRIFNNQQLALIRRLRATDQKKMVLGVSGGLDSALALLVCAETARYMGSADNVIAVTMPGFGTSNRTNVNAVSLCEALGVDLRTVDIREQVEMHLRDIGHDGSAHDAAFENAQARERTQVLMDIANMENALVIGTGDMSELALGWCTYNGDQMSMYSVNAGLPKTLVKAVVSWYCEEHIGDECGALADILETPISPELVPGGQNTESIIGPYELHDFFLYHTVRWGIEPSELYKLAVNSFTGVYDGDMIKACLKIFLNRFTTQQFKRDPMPAGAQMIDISLDPAKYALPSDMSPDMFLKELEEL